MTKNELLALAKILNITGRHEMTKEALQSAVSAQQGETQTQDHEAIAQMEKTAESGASVDRVKNIVRRYPSLKPRDANGKIVRAGRNLSGNQPFAYKYYYLNPSLKDETQWTAGYREAFNAAPNQVKLILKSMARYHADKMNPGLGANIVDTAKSSGTLASKIDSDRLFAYYRRALETLGVIHAVGWDDENEAEEIEAEVEDQEEQDDEDESEAA